MVGVTSDLLVGSLTGTAARGREDGRPEEDLSHDRQEPHQGSQHEVASVDELLMEIDLKDGGEGITDYDEDESEFLMPAISGNLIIKIRYIKQGKPIEEDVECNFDNISNKENMILEFNQSSNTWMPNWNK